MPNYCAMSAHADNPDEIFDTYTEQGEKLSPMRRDQVHAQGIWHKAVNVMLFRSSGTLVLQQRAAAKSVCPLAWDLSVAEHLQVDESWEDAAHRGVAEELGIIQVALEPCGPEIQERFDLPEQNIHNYEFQRCFRGVSDDVLKLDPAEVKATREVLLADFWREATGDPEQFTPWLLAWAKLLKPELEPGPRH